MPRLPTYVAREGLPTSTGMPGGIVQVPVVPAPLAGDMGPSAVEQALGGLAGSLEQAGGLLSQAEALKGHRQKALDVLTAKTAHHDWQIPMQETYARLRAEDWQHLPERVVEEGHKLITTHGRDLSPQAQTLFTEDAKQTLAVWHQRAIAEQSARMDQASQYEYARSVQTAQEAYSQATTPYEREVAKGQFLEATRRWAATGLANSTALAQAERETFKRLAVQDVQNAIQRDPPAMLTQLDAQLAGTATREDLPLAPVEQLAQLRQQAGEVVQARTAQVEHQERYTQWQTEQRQRQNSVDYRGQLYTTPLTPANVPTFQTLIAQVHAAMAAGDLDPVTGEHLMATAQAHAAAAAKPPVPVDDPAIERTVSLAIMLAETPQQFAQARETLTAAGVSRLTPETFRALADKIESREKANYWRNLPEVVAAKEVLVRGVVVPYGGMLAGIVKPQQQQQLIWAMDQWEYALQQRLADPQQGVAAVKREAWDLAWDARLKFLHPGTGDLADEYLPAPARAAQTEDQLKMVVSMLRQQQWAPGTLRQIVDNWHRWQADLRVQEERRQRGQRGSSGTTPTLPGAPSWQLPGSPAGPSSEPRSR